MPKRLASLPGLAHAMLAALAELQPVGAVGGSAAGFA